MGCQCSEPNKDKQVLIEENSQAVPEDDSNSKSNMNLTPQNDNNNNENAKEQKNEQEEHPQIQNSNPEPPKEEKKEEPKEEKKEEPSTPKEQENKDPNIEVVKEDNQEKEVPKPIEKVKASKPKYDISKYPKDVFDLINKIREDPPKFAEDVEKAISLIKEENGKLIYSGKLKVALNKGEPLFREVINILKSTPSLAPLTFNENIKIECPLEEEEIKDPKVFQNKIIEKKKQIELHAYFKDAIKDPYISTLLMIVDDSGKNAGKKRESLLNPEFKNIAISSIMVHKTFCAYFTFSK